MIAARRRRHVPKSERPEPGEHVFHFGLFDHRLCVHRIVRKTATRMWVESWCRDPECGPLEFFERGPLEQFGALRLGVFYV